MKKQILRVAQDDSDSSRSIVLQRTTTLCSLSLVCSVAFFVFFAGAAGAGIVASDFIAGSALGRGFGGAAAGHARLFQLTLFLPLELLLDIVDRCRRLTRRDWHRR